MIRRVLKFLLEKIGLALKKLYKEPVPKPVNKPSGTGFVIFK